MFEPIGYREWMAGRPEAALYDLGTTALRGARGRQRTAAPAPVAELGDPPAGVTLHTLLATEYGVDPEQVVVTAGSAHATFLAAAAALDADGGSRFLVESPGPEALAATPASLGATVDRLDRPGGELPAGRLEDAIDEATALVSVTNRHDPTGRLAEPATLETAAGAASGAGARLLVEESYAPYTAEPRGDAPFGGVTAAGLEDAVAVGSLSEYWGLPELRVGWLVADREFAAATRRVKRHVPGVADTSAALAERALYADDFPDRELLAENTALLEEFVAGRPETGGEVHTSFAFLDPPVGGDRLAEAAREEGLLVVPGRFFGDPGRVRVALGRAPADGAVALERLGAVIDGVG